MPKCEHGRNSVHSVNALQINFAKSERGYPLQLLLFFFFLLFCFVIACTGTGCDKCSADNECATCTNASEYINPSNTAECIGKNTL